ncbi:unnamed protein product [Pylaiella littoralis]
MPAEGMDVSSYTLAATSCFLAVKLTFQPTRQATPKRPKRGRAKGGAPQQTTQKQQAQQGSDNSSTDTSTSQSQSQGAHPHLNLPTDIAFKSFIIAALKDLHGDVGSLAYPVDVLSWDAASGEGRLRAPARAIVPIRAALSLVGSCGSVPCAIDVTEASPFLAGLACERFL